MRNPDNITTGLPTDYWLVTSTDQGASFGNEVRTTPTSFDMSIAPNAGGLFLGDYEGLGVKATAFVPFFVQTVSSRNPTDVFTTSIYRHLNASRTTPASTPAPALFHS